MNASDNSIHILDNMILLKSFSGMKKNNNLYKIDNAPDYLNIGLTMIDSEKRSVFNIYADEAYLIH